MAVNNSLYIHYNLFVDRMNNNNVEINVENMNNYLYSYCNDYQLLKTLLLVRYILLSKVTYASNQLKIKETIEFSTNNMILTYNQIVELLKRMMN